MESVTTKMSIATTISVLALIEVLLVSHLRSKSWSLTPQLFYWFIFCLFVGISLESNDSQNGSSKFSISQQSIVDASEMYWTFNTNQIENEERGSSCLRVIPIWIIF